MRRITRDIPPRAENRAPTCHDRARSTDEPGAPSPPLLPMPLRRENLPDTAYRGAPTPTTRKRHSRAKERTIRDRGSTSGCHCTPSAQRDAGTSIASTRSSNTLQPVATTPSPRHRPPGDGATWSRAATRPQRARRASPARAGRRGRRCRRSRASAGGRCGRRPRAGAGRASRRARRSSAASRGRCRARACRARARAAPARSRRRRGPGGCWSSSGAARRRRTPGSMSAPPASSSPSSPSSTSSGCSGDPRVRREHQRDRARALDRVHVGSGEQERLAVPYRPARPLERGADADSRSPCRSFVEDYPRFTDRSHLEELDNERPSTAQTAPWRRSSSTARRR